MDNFDELRKLVEDYKATPQATAAAVNIAPFLSLIIPIARMFITDAAILAIIQKVVDILLSIFPQQTA